MKTLVALLLLGSVTGVLVAQEVEPSPTNGLTPAAIEMRITALQAAPDVDEATRAKALELWNQALETVRLIETEKATGDRFETDRKETPDRLATTRKDLTETPPETKPEVPKDATLAELEQTLAATRTRAQEAARGVQDLDKVKADRSDKLAQLPQLIADAKRRVVEQTEKPSVVVAPDDPHPVAEAKRTLVRARARLLETKVVALEREQASYEARRELLVARHDLASRRANREAKLVQAWIEIVQAAREADNRKAQEQANAAIEEAKRTHPRLSETAEENLRLTADRSKLSAKISKATAERQKADETLKELDSRFAEARLRVEKAGLTDIVGHFLRQERTRLLPSVRGIAERVEARKEELAEVQIEGIELDRMRTRVLDPQAEIEQIMSSLPAEMFPGRRSAIRAAAEEILNARLDYLDALQKDTEAYLDLLGHLVTTQTQLVERTEEFRDYVDERVLWIRTSRPLWETLRRPADLALLRDAALYLVSPQGWQEVAVALLEDAERQPALHILAALAIIALFAGRKTLKRRIIDTGAEAERGSCTNFSPTSRAALLTLTIAIAWPTLTLFLAFRLGASGATGFAADVGSGLRELGLVLLGLEVFRHVLRPRGLAESHFRWSSRERFRRHLLRCMAVIIPAAFIVGTLDHKGESGSIDTLGRVAFILMFLTNAAYNGYVLHPSEGILAVTDRRNSREWSKGTRVFCFLLGMAVPLALLVITLLGYLFTVRHLSDRLGAMSLLFFLVALLDSAVLRGLLLAKRRLLIKQSRERKKQAVDTEAAGATDAVTLEESALDLATVDQQSRKLARAAVTIAVLVATFLIWDDVLPALRRLREFEVGPVTLASLLRAVVILSMTAIATRNIPGMLEITVLQRLDMQSGQRNAITTISRYAIVVIGLVAAFTGLGIPWSKVQWLAASVMFALGFGLQEIFANFVSGLIILVEQPVRVGDLVTVGDMSGRVARIQMRATTITDFDRRELIIPNKEFITGRIINWTLTDTVTRVVIPVGIAYGSDTALARQILMDVAHESALVLKEPAPSAIFKAFGDSALNFDLRVFISDRDKWPQLLHEVHTEIDNRFRAAKIEIAFPQRDVHIRSYTGSRDVMPVDEKEGSTRSESTRSEKAEIEDGRPASSRA